MMTMMRLERKLRKNDKKQAVLYLFCNFISLMLITSYVLMMYSDTVQTIFPEGGDSRKQLMAIFVLTLFGCVVFTVYASSLFFRKKSRQLGILMALGASKKKLFPGLITETLLLSSTSAFLGILAGFPFVILIWNSFRFLLADTKEMVLSLNPGCLVISLLFFLLVVGCSCVTAYGYLRRTDILEVIQEEHKNEPVKELGKWCGPVGLLLLLAGAAAGYYVPVIIILQFQVMPPWWINLLYAPVFIGLYMMILHVVVNGVLPRRKNPWKNLISRSMMKFQGRQTVNSLLVCTVLAAGGAFAIFYVPMLCTGQMMAVKEQPYDYGFFSRSDQDIPQKEEIISMASDYELQIKDWKQCSFLVLGTDGETDVMDTKDSWHYEYRKLLKEGRFLSESDYEKMTGQEISVKPGTYLGICRADGTAPYDLSSSIKVLTNMSSREEHSVAYAGNTAYDFLASQIPFYVLSDEDYQKLRLGQKAQWIENLVFFNVSPKDDYQFAYELFLAIVRGNGPECELPSYYDRVAKIRYEEKGETYWGDTDEMTVISFDSPDSSDFRNYWTYMPNFRLLSQNDFMKTFAVFLMMFLFISIVCNLAVAIICYTRCQTIALNNRYVFDDLKRLGGSPRFLKKEVRTQCSRVFSLPSIIGMTAMYLLYVGIMFANDGRLTLTEIAGLAVCLGVLAVIGLIFFLVYRYTVRKIEKQLGI